jgi:cell division protein FtsB
MLKFNNMFLKVLKIIFTKYTITFIAFIVWMVFFDSDNILTRKHYHSKLNELKQEKHFYLEEIRKDSTLTHRLLTDSLALEKYAREKYLMKRDKEDVYIVSDTTAGRHQ